MISIEGLNKADVLAALYNSARPQSMGFLHYTPELMTTAKAAEILATGQTYFDYLGGRVMKVDLGSDELREGLYDRDNGAGAAAKAIAGLTAGA